MKKVSLKGLVSGLTNRSREPVWQPADGPYPLLRGFTPPQDLAGQTGVYAVWHRGVRPQWLRVGWAADLGVCLKQLTRADWLMRHEDNGGVYVAWMSATGEQAGGMARFLTEKLKPAFQEGIFAGEKASDESVPPSPCPFPPGTQS